MKPYTKEDVEHVLKEYNERLDSIINSEEAKQCPSWESAMAELTVGARRLDALLNKSEDKWTFDDYMAFYRVKEFLS